MALLVLLACAITLSPISQPQLRMWVFLSKFRHKTGVVAGWLLNSAIRDSSPQKKRKRKTGVKSDKGKGKRKRNLSSKDSDSEEGEVTSSPKSSDKKVSQKTPPKADVPPAPSSDQSVPSESSECGLLLGNLYASLYKGNFYFLSFFFAS